MPKCQVIISVCGGAILEAFCSEDRAELVIVDWDVEDCDPSAPDMVQVLDDVGRETPACVMRCRTSPLSYLHGTMVDAVLREARIPCDAV